MPFVDNLQASSADCPFAIDWCYLGNDSTDPTGSLATPVNFLRGRSLRPGLSAQVSPIEKVDNPEYPWMTSGHSEPLPDGWQTVKLLPCPVMTFYQRLRGHRLRFEHETVPVPRPVLSGYSTSLAQIFTDGSTRVRRKKIELGTLQPRFPGKINGVRKNILIVFVEAKDKEAVEGNAM